MALGREEAKGVVYDTCQLLWAADPVTGGGAAKVRDIDRTKGVTASAGRDVNGNPGMWLFGSLERLILGRLERSKG